MAAEEKAEPGTPAQEKATSDRDGCLLIFLPDQTAQGADSSHLPDVEAEQTLAIAHALREGENFAPLVLCPAGSWGHRQASALGIPHLAVKRRRSPLLLFRLWLWQRRHAHALVLTTGGGAMPLGRTVRRLRRPGTALLAHAFFAALPPEEVLRGKTLWTAEKIICGNGELRRLLSEAAPDARHDRFELLAPGIGERFCPPAPQACPRSTPEDGGHFIFGMGWEGRTNSGVLTVVRAMSALWQVGGLPPWEVRVVGSIPGCADVLEEAERLGVASRLCLLGDQSPPDFLAACHAWIAPGLSPQEPPAALWAGFAAGLPVICSGSALHVELLSGCAATGENFAGAAVIPVVPPDDPQALALAMRELMASAPWRNVPERAARARACWDIARTAADACRLFSAWREARDSVGDARQDVP
ncbi:MAG: glycosyltransferase [Desulfovibrio sp.]|jgi:glycosyltransferase involved in cell wall biosynthesis|nr:glycosyltransferase [Desulfovibrio sp.]